MTKERVLTKVQEFADAIRMKALTFRQTDHIERDHFTISRSGLRARVYRKRAAGIEDGDLGIRSRFTCEKANEIYELIAQVIEDNADSIARWYLKAGEYAEKDFESYFPQKVGEGYAALLTGFSLYQMSGVSVWISIRGDGSLYLNSAYPVPDPDETDVMWDAYYDI